MSTELKYLAFTALLTASLWIPYVVAQVRTNGFLIPENYIDPKQRPLPFWGQRADRAYLNAVETFAPFAARVLLVQVTGKAVTDRLLGDQLLLAPRCPRRRLPGRLALYPHADLRPRLGVHRGAVRRAGEIGAT